MGKTRIVIVTDVTGNGGAERIATAQALSLDPSRYQKTLVVTRDLDPRQRECYRDPALEIISLQRRGKRDFYKLLRLIGIFKRADVIHAHKHGSLFYAILLGKLLCRRKVVAHLHTKLSQLRPFHRWLTRYLCHAADRVVFVSETDLREISGAWRLNRGKLRLIYNAVDVERFGNTARETARQALKFPAGCLLIGMVGRLDRLKGYECFLEAAAEVLNRCGRRAHFLAAGAAPEAGYLEELLNLSGALGIWENIHFLGQREDIAQILAALDIFVLSSRVECLPVALLEAMASGLPVVSTRVGGIPEVIADGENGLLVPPDEPALLADALMLLIVHPERRRLIAENGFRTVSRRYSLAGMMRALDDLYTEMVGSGL